MSGATKYFSNSPWFPSLFICLNETAVIGLDQVMKRLPRNGIVPWLESIRDSLPMCDYDPNFTTTPVVVAMVISIVYTIFKTSILKCFGSKPNSEISAILKSSSSIWICLYSILTVTIGIFLVKEEHNKFFFKPSTSFVYWDQCTAVSTLSDLFLFLQMGFHLHSFLVLSFDNLEKRLFLHIKIISHFTTFILLVVTYLLGFFEPLMVLVILFEVREFLWQVTEQTMSPQCGISKLGATALSAFSFYQCVLIYWLITKFIYFFVVLYPVKAKQNNFYLLLLSLFTAVLSIEMYRVVALMFFCYKKGRASKQEKKEQSKVKKNQ